MPHKQLINHQKFPAIHVSSSAPNPANPTWGDYHFIRLFVKALARAGASASIESLTFAPTNIDQNNPPVIIRVAGPHLPDPVDGAINVVWQISHHELIIPEIYDEFDLVFIASEKCAQKLSERMAKRPIYLPQATDWARTPLTCSIENRQRKTLFVGNARGKKPREIVKIAMDARVPIKVAGNYWAGLVPAQDIISKHVEYGSLKKLYNSYLFGLNDHWGTMKSGGFINNRLFDTMACGAIPICDNVEITDSDLRSLVYQVESPLEIKSVVDHVLGLSSNDLKERQCSARDLIARRYSFDAVASTIIKEIGKYGKRRQVNTATINKKLMKPPAVFCDWTDGPSWPDQRELCNSNSSQKPQIYIGGVGFAKATELSHGDTVALAKRIVRITERYLNYDPNYGAEIFVNAIDDSDVAQLKSLSINNMTASYRELIEHISVHPKSALCSENRRILNAIRNRANRYLIREFFVRDPENLFAMHVPRDMHDRRLNEMYTYPDLKIHPLDRDALKPFIRMPGLSRGDSINDLKVAIVIHAFYPGILPRILKQIISLRHCPLFISTDSGRKYDSICEKVRKSGFKDFEVRIVPNVGRDVFPKLFAFKDILSEHELFLHLHTKKSTHIEGNVWLDKILGDIAGDDDALRRILSLFSKHEWLGCVYPRAHYGLLSHVWGVNREMGRELLHRLGFEYPCDEPFLRFPSGSMYWMRSEILQEIANLDLEPSDFQPEAGQLDGTLAHAFERVMGVLPGLLGYRSVCYSGTKDRIYSRFAKTAQDDRQFEELASSSSTANRLSG